MSPIRRRRSAAPAKNPPIEEMHQGRNGYRGQVGVKQPKCQIVCVSAKPGELRAKVNRDTERHGQGQIEEQRSPAIHYLRTIPISPPRSCRPACFPSLRPTSGLGKRRFNPGRTPNQQAMLRTSSLKISSPAGSRFISSPGLSVTKLGAPRSVSQLRSARWWNVDIATARPKTPPSNGSSSTATARLNCRPLTVLVPVATTLANPIPWARQPPPRADGGKIFDRTHTCSRALQEVRSARPP